MDRLAPHKVIGLDTEADSLHSYHEKICLVQVASPEGCYLIDPLAGFDISPFYACLSGHTVIIHGADYDLRLLGRNPAFGAVDVFDTSIAARFAGLDQIGYAALIQKFFGVTLCKASQRADWGRRPLPPRMEEYALNDVRYLIELGGILEKTLRDLGRWEWYCQTRDQMVASAREPRERDPEMAWRINGSSKLAPREAAILRALWHWRDAEASAWDRPTFHVLSNDRMIEVAKDAAAGRRPELPRMPSNRHARFQDALRAALELPESAWPVFEREHRARPNGASCRRFEQLRQKRDRLARELGLDPALIASRQTLMSAAQDNGARLLPWQSALLQLDEPGGH